MSYDIRLKDINNNTILLPVKHLMIGGTYEADYDEKTKTFSPKPKHEAILNITFNYSRYYFEATQNDIRFMDKQQNAGLRGLDGKTGVESISMLQDMINKIINKYQHNNEWFPASRTRSRYFDSNNRAIDLIYAIRNNIPYVEEEYVIDLPNGEGPCDDYWMDTAGNAIIPLQQMLAMANLRPDGIWEIC